MTILLLVLGQALSERGSHLQLREERNSQALAFKDERTLSCPDSHPGGQPRQLLQWPSTWRPGESGDQPVARALAFETIEMH